jgi:hypothetical protein
VLTARCYDRQGITRSASIRATRAEPAPAPYRLRCMRRIYGLLAVLALLASACTVAGPSVPDKVAVSGIATAGPTCPVERPGDSACAARPVAGATIVVTTPGGAEVARVTTGADGRFTVDLSAGDYVLVPQDVVGLMGTAAALAITVPPAGSPAPTPFELQYDTGIR